MRTLRRAARRGAAALEFALSAGVLLVLLFAILDWSWFLFQYMTLTVATQRGTRIAAGIVTEEDPAGQAEAATLAWIAEYGLDPASVDVQASSTEGPTGPEVTVLATLDFQPLVGLAPSPELVRAGSAGVWYGWVY